MVTSLRISEKTKEELLKLKATLELKTGKRHSLEDAIVYLLEKEASKR